MSSRQQAPHVSDAAFVAIDFESAGAAQGRTDVPIQIGIAELADGGIAPPRFFRTFLTPSRPVVWTSRDVHAIREEDLDGAPTYLDVWPELEKRLTTRFVVAHNVGTEKKFLRTFAMHEFGPWIDTLRLARAFYPTLKSHALGDLISTFKLEPEMRSLCPDLKWHDALYDAVASLVFLKHLIAAANLADFPAESLTRADLSDYFKKR